MKRISAVTLFALASLAFVLALAARNAPAAEAPQLDYPFVVVRAYFDDPALVREVASWKEPWELNRDEGYIVVDATPAEFDQLEAMGFRLEIDAKLTTLLNAPPPADAPTDGIPGFPCYRTVEETFASAEAIVANYPNLAAWIDIGDSWEKTNDPLDGYDIMVLRLTNAAVPGPKPKTFIMTAIHAREYTTAELNTRFAEFLVQNYGVDADVTWMLDHQEVHLLLQSNPDGRKQAETGILWRKNTNENYCGPTSQDRGADLNRNFEFQWGCCGGSSSFECSETYRGPSPDSEPEVDAVQDYVRSIFPDQREPDLNAAAPLTATGVFMDIHSYGQDVLWPWGFTFNVAPNGTQLQTLGRKFAFFNGYDPYQAIGLYPTDGTTDDFAYGDLGLAGYTFELGTSFFQSCGTFESVILPDNLDALHYAVKASRTPYMTPAGPDALGVAVSALAVAQGTPVDLTAQINDTRFNNQNGTEPVQNIVAAEYYIDVPAWVTATAPISIPMTASDGTFNNPIEAVEAVVDTAGLDPGRHTLYVRGQDAAGNWGAYTASFLFIVDPAVSPVIEGTVIAADTSQPLEATVTANGLFTAQTDPATGYYSMQVVSGTYDLVVEPVSPDYGPAAVDDLVAQDYQTIEQDFVLYPYCVSFEDDVEAGNQGWTADAPWAIVTEASHSPTHSWTDSPGTNYQNNWSKSLTSPSFDLSEYSGVQLNYWQICDTESGYDYCTVEVSNDGGATWTAVASYDGPHTQWQEVTLDTPQLDGAAQARLRFHLTTDVSVTDDGWHVDDIRLIGSGPGCGGLIPPTAAFSSTSPDYLGETTAFTNESYGSTLTYEWDFGDGSPISTEMNPTHDYAAVGLYTVALTATNDLGSNTVTGTVEILAVEPAVAGFTSTSPDFLGEPTQFTNTSTGTNLTFEWDFGDGSPVSTEEHPSHTYAAAGAYTVTLTATNSLGSSTVEGTVLILTPGESWFLYLPAVIGET